MVTTIQCPHCTKPVVVPQAEVPSGLNDICSRFPSLCQQVSRLEAGLKQVMDSLDRHPLPTPEFLKLWRTCPDCAPKLKALVEERPELFQFEGKGDDKYLWEKKDYGAT